MDETNPLRLGRRMVGFGLLGSLVAGATAARSALPPPGRVLVYDFTIQWQKVALDPSLRARLSQMSGGDAAREQQAIAAEVQNTIAETLVSQIRGMGLSTMRAGPSTILAGNDVAVRGQITRISAGNETRRRIIGFGAGKSEIDADAELLRGPTLLRSYSAEANSGHTPGLALGGASAAAGHAGAAIGGTAAGAANRAHSGLSAEAEHLAERIAANLGQFFAQQGWIKAPTGQ